MKSDRDNIEQNMDLNNSLKKKAVTKSYSHIYSSSESENIDVKILLLMALVGD